MSESTKNFKEILGEKVEELQTDKNIVQGNLLFLLKWNITILLNAKKSTFAVQCTANGK